MAIAPTKVTTAAGLEDRSWLHNLQGVGQNLSDTIDLSLFTAATHYLDGYIKSGTVLGRVTATGFLGPASAAATDGRQTPVGHLYNSKTVSDPAGKDECALFRRGAVRRANLPANSGLTAAFEAAMPQIQYS